MKKGAVDARKDVKNYYDSDGPSMADMFPANQIEHFDKAIVNDLTKLLKNIKENRRSR